MSEYRRDRTPGGTWFFTVVTCKRRRVLTHPAVRLALRQAVEKTRISHPFAINAWVLLPEHLHCLWTLPNDDTGFSARWSIIKRRTSQALADRPDLLPPSTQTRTKRRESTLWQRRFWEHRIRDEDDLRHHLDYIHWNPVKHEHVTSVADWPWSTFHRWVERGWYPNDWGGQYTEPQTMKFGE